MRHPTPPPIECEPYTYIPNLDLLEPLIELAYFANRYEHANAKEAEELLGNRSKGFASQARLIGRYARLRFLAYKDPDSPYPLTPEQKVALLTEAEQVYLQIKPEYRWRTHDHHADVKIRQVSIVVTPEHTIRVSDKATTKLYTEYKFPTFEEACRAMEALTHIFEELNK